MNDRERALVQRLIDIAEDGLGITNAYHHNVDQHEYDELEAIKAELFSNVCAHRLVDARNPYVKSGYLCIDCGAVFSAADH